MGGYLKRWVSQQIRNLGVYRKKEKNPEKTFGYLFDELHPGMVLMVLWDGVERGKEKRRGKGKQM
jgi:hypothetical protein